MHRAAEMHKALDKEWHIRDEALLRHREELDTHKLALMQQIQNEKNSWRRSKLVFSFLQRKMFAVRRKKQMSDSTRLMRFLLCLLERYLFSSVIESLRNRLRHLEKEAAAAKFAKESAEAAASEAFRERTTESWEMDARMAELHERCADAERRAECNAEDGLSCSSSCCCSVS